MTATSRRAEPSDLPALESLYRGLETEMVALSPMWPLAEGLEEPLIDSLRAALTNADTTVVVGEYDGQPLGFMLARVEGLLAQANGERLGSIRLVFVDVEARQVGIGEAMREAVLAEFRAAGLTRFDAHVLPGHRLAKNFFEQGGFSARSIIMHHDDNRIR